MFNQSKYTRIYYSIIENALTRVPLTYVECHHIIPKSLGGSNSQSNIVKLTAREHYICHLLLTKMVDGEARKKMVYALWILSNKTSKKNSKIYQSTRESFAELMKKRKHSPEAIEKMKKAQKGKIISQAHRERLRVINTGLVRNFTDEHRENLSKAGKGRVITPEWREKLSQANKGQGKGRKLSDETKAKVSAARRATLARNNQQ
jgi:hypothetical protein